MPTSPSPRRSTMSTPVSGGAACRPCAEPRLPLPLHTHHLTPALHAAPHMGSAYPTIAADAIARYQRLRGRQVTFITGTDEHGEKIALAAAKRGMAPKEHCDDIVASYKQLWSDVRFQLRCRPRRGGPTPVACCVAAGSLLLWPLPPALPSQPPPCPPSPLPPAGHWLRLVHPHDRPAARGAGVPGAGAGVAGRRHLQGRLPGLVLRGLRGVQGRGRHGRGCAARAGMGWACAARRPAACGATGANGLHRRPPCPPRPRLPARPACPPAPQTRTARCTGVRAWSARRKTTSSRCPSIRRSWRSCAATRVREGGVLAVPLLAAGSGRWHECWLGAAACMPPSSPAPTARPPSCRRLCAARVAAQRGAGVGQVGGARLLHLTRGSGVGHPGAARPTPDRVRLVRRAQRIPVGWVGG